MPQKSYTDRIKALVSRPHGAGPATPAQPVVPTPAESPAPSDTTRGHAGRPPSGPIIFSTTKTKKDKGKPKFGSPVLRGRRSLPANDWRVIALTVASVALAVLSLVLVWFLAVIRPKMQAHIAEQQAKLALEVKQREELVAALAAKDQELVRAHSLVGVLVIDAQPAGAQASFAGRTAACPTNFSGVALGTYTLTVHKDGYEDFVETIQVTNDVPIARSVQLVPSTGQLVIETQPAGALFSIEAGDRVIRSGEAPAVIQNLPVGAYAIRLKKGEAEHRQEVTVQRNQATEVRHRFRIGRLRIESEPAGADVLFKGRVVGKTPVILAELPESAFDIELRLRKFLPRRVTAQIVADHETRVSERLDPNLGPPPGQDFTSSIGLEMVWLADGFWVSRHEVTQAQFLTVIGSDPSSNKGRFRPVDSVTWRQASAFCDKLTAAEDAAESLPSGFRFNLPTESEWLGFAGPQQPGGVTVLGSTIGTTDVNRAPANGLGLRGVWGNVWEWCLDPDGRGRVLLGGGWTPIYDGLKQITDRTTAPEDEANPSFGFRVILKKTRK
ncbi:MAG: PEGA domain-containing protein [Verrucomicrobiae bacterium]|nr:PEGA domain-containing protein [Verrucomicrobiae bacterium]